MRVAVLADIHGNLPALEAVLRDLADLHPDAIWIAGDFIGGPQVNGTLDLLCAFTPCAIRGNSDTGVLRYIAGEGPPEWRDNHQFALLRWAARHLQPAHAGWLRCLPEELVITPEHLPAVRMVHGRPGDPSDGLCFDKRDPQDISEALASIDEPALICAHTHEAWSWGGRHRLAFNPGSVAADLTGDARAKYALLEEDSSGWQVQLRAITYDHGALRQAFQQSGLLEEGGPLARAFLLSSETGHDVSRYLLEYAYAQMGSRGCPPSPYIPDDVWDWAAETFDWSRHEEQGRT